MLAYTAAYCAPLYARPAPRCNLQPDCCIWPLQQAVNSATRPGDVLLQENYGKDDDAAVEAVKGIYRELKLEQVFLKYEQDSYDAIMAAIQKQSQLPHAIFTAFLQKIYKRTK